MTKKFTIAIFISLFLAGCGSGLESDVNSYKDAIENEKTDELIEMVDVEEGDLGREEAEAYISLINEAFSEDDFEKEVDQVIEDLDDNSKEAKIKSSDELDFTYAIFEWDEENEVLAINIPRYEVGADFPPGDFPIELGEIDTNIETNDYAFQKIGWLVPGIYAYQGQGQAYGSDFNFDMDIDFSKEIDDRVSLNGDIYTLEINIKDSNLSLSQLEVNGDKQEKNDDGNYTFRSDQDTAQIDFSAEYDGREIEIESMSKEVDFAEKNIIELEASQKEIDRVKKEISNEKKADSRILGLFRSATVVLETDSGWVKQSVIKDKFVDKKTSSQFIEHLNEFADSSAKFDYNIKNQETVGDQADLKYNVTVEYSKNKKDYKTKEYEIILKEESDKLIVEEMNTK